MTNFMTAVVVIGDHRNMFGYIRLWFANDSFESTWVRVDYQMNQDVSSLAYHCHTEIQSVSQKKDLIVGLLVLNKTNYSTLVDYGADSLQ